MLDHEPLYQVTDKTGDLTLFVRCKICQATIWDRSKDGPVKHDLLVTTGIAHLTIQHGYIIKPGRNPQPPRVKQ